MSNEWDRIITCNKTGRKFEAVGFGDIRDADFWLGEGKVCSSGMFLKKPEGNRIILKPLPQRGEIGYKYWYIDDDIDWHVYIAIDSGSSEDKLAIHFGNYYDTEEEAKAVFNSIFEVKLI